MTFKLLIKQHFEFLSLQGGCKGLSESTLVKMPHCTESRNQMTGVSALHQMESYVYNIDEQCISPAFYFESWPKDYNIFFMLNSTEHEISTAHKN